MFYKAVPQHIKRGLVFFDDAEKGLKMSFF